MLLELKLLLSLVLIVSATYDVGNSQKIHITHGEEDVFSNPKCLGHQQAGCPSCDGFNAVCAEDNCTKCRCAGNDRTFVLTRGQYGQCVANEYFLYSTCKCKLISWYTLLKNQRQPVQPRKSVYIQQSVLVFYHTHLVQEFFLHILA